MTWTRGVALASKIRRWRSRGRYDADTRHEVATHLELLTDRYVQQGMTRPDAERAARREFGNAAIVREDVRTKNSFGWLDRLTQDVRYAARRVTRTPGLSAVIVGVLALGLGFNAAIFVFVSAFTNGPLPGTRRDASIVRIRGIDRQSAPGRTIGREFSHREFLDYAAQTTLFSDVAAWMSADVVLGVGDGPENLQSAAATFVTPAYFSVLGLRPAAGMGLSASTDPAEPQLAAVISDLIWSRYYDRRADVIGRSIAVNGVTVTIAGVAPRRFNGARTGGSQMRVWLPLSARPVVQRATASSDPEAAVFGIIARLQPGVLPEETAPTVRAIASRAALSSSASRPGGDLSADVVPLLAENYFPPGGETPAVAGRVIATMIPTLVLLITCTNVSALVAALAVARRREIAVRLALGASRRRVVRQLVTETVLMASAAGSLGLLVVVGLWRLFEASIPDLQLVFDWRSLLFTFALALGTGVIFGLSPALHATRLALSDVLKETASAVAVSRSRLQAGLVVAQIAFTQPALLGMGALLLHANRGLSSLPATVSADRIADVRFNTNPRYGSMDEARERALARLQARLAAIPQIEAVVPQAANRDYVDIAVNPADAVPGGDSASFEARLDAAPPGYFAIMSVAIVRGRAFEAGDRTDQGAAIVSANLARRLWPDSDPIGRRFYGRPSNEPGARSFTVVGVAADLATGDRERVFVPDVRTIGHFLVLTKGPAQPVLQEIRSAAYEEAPDHPVVGARTLGAIQQDERSTAMRVVAGAGATGGIALLLSAIGLYSVVAFAVSQRIHEIGIRTSLGATGRDVVRLFLWRGVRLAVIGLVLGIGISMATLKLMTLSIGDDASPGTGMVAVLVALVVTSVALLATWIPARRAAAVDPIAALRNE